ncbi:hypothetical protein GO283_04555 [Ralstonia solanacearum]|uniref:hypothetical protein n=1 Tax=Ralstonia pseudosolanacearum TaxID=1310165 RepID=UPI0012DA05D9|nr:hypothetical protein [Ralstonia pseudosolanacearum]NKA32804.1 hypothetical protein [Ralstonia solanacearum]NKA74378.1 hypothetical protein [Ralstonia solanacearum]NKA95997.1 hypothetical protein [Ralstonia solanacearum]NKF87967.1 hypothetical protein [Ralstonia solanacearum]NKF96401.1 hypothetical protein [Ralstonia solanacearum]
MAAPKRHLNVVRPNDSGPHGVDGHGGGGDDGGMDARIKALEDGLATVKTDIAVVKSNYATKSDIESTKAAIAEAKTTIILWVVSAIFLAQLLPTFLKKLGL